MELIKHLEQTYTSANEIPLSDAEFMFKSDAFEQWKRGRDGVTDIWIGIAERLNAVIEAIGNQSKTIANVLRRIR
ncbi:MULTISPECIES: hypothetical protein [Pseudomonas]|uniref:hypothetical protein n=1 Tax=Pseudomonas TaxID=286 RepID=UPI00135662B5|nr:MULTISPECIES: hypothetical protein [Pseudomonas]